MESKAPRENPNIINVSNKRNQNFYVFLGKQLLKQAYKNGNEKAADYMVTFGFIRSRKEMEAEMLNTADEEIVSQMA